MLTNPKTDASERSSRQSLDLRLATYATAAIGVTAVYSSSAEAAVIGNHSVVPFGINESVSIDLNGDGELDFEIDHDRVDLSGSDIDFLQIDKNDQVGLPLPGTDFADGGALGANSDHEYLTDVSGNYPVALSQGESIGPSSPGLFEFQESDNYLGGGTTLRANRLINEDAGQLDADASVSTTLPGGSEGWLGLGGDVGYLGLRINFDGGASEFNYGWVGVRITNEADATGEIVGFGYNDTPNAPISAGQIPEPGGLLLACVAVAIFSFGFLRRRALSVVS